MKINGDFIKREIAGDIILVPVGETAIRFNGMLTVTESGSVIWDDLLAGKSKAEIIDHLLSIYETEREILEKDYDEFIAALEKNDLIKR